MSKVTTISHDAFSRVETVRRSAPKGKGCANCDRPARFQYGEQSDGFGALVMWDKHEFCSISCRRSYHA